MGIFFLPPEGPSTQTSRQKEENAITGTAFGTYCLDVWELGPSRFLNPIPTRSLGVLGSPKRPPDYYYLDLFCPCWEPTPPFAYAPLEYRMERWHVAGFCDPVGQSFRCTLQVKMCSIAIALRVQVPIY